MSNWLRTLTAVVVVAAFLAMCGTTATDSYITIDGIRVAKSLRISTRSQLDRRLRQGNIEIDFREAEISEMRPLDSVASGVGADSCPSYYRWICG
ncbi:hypothetical protein JS528_06925 [Bifidobacterium sp. MA2]|uniref:Uncharacterized protein n=1 Tax=Bifidobacterium santillanense TaxID=2809028 RepID=A0ABS5UQB9_9BIFI|nr:hypothetical protein [Bifidobacterium santillanense]MBT1173087.1 hypothetical protein [Bifidobacterium santillanense]